MGDQFAAVLEIKGSDSPCRNRRVLEAEREQKDRGSKDGGRETELRIPPPPIRLMFAAAAAASSSGAHRREREDSGVSETVYVCEFKIDVCESCTSELGKKSNVSIDD
ncbi:hypothetical protein Dimus_015087 [Dionaea muscipula]